MKKRFRLITALVVVLCMLSMCVFGAYAVDYDGDGIDDDQSSYEGGDGGDNGDGGQDEPPAVDPDPVVEPEPDIVVTDPIIIDPPVETQPDYSDGGDDWQPDYSYTEPDPYQGGYDDSEVGYTDPPVNYDDYYYGDVDTDAYVGGGQTYDPPQSTAPSAALYDVDDRKIDDGVLSDSDWGDISLSLQNANLSGDDSDVGDFSFIQKNNSSGDNGHWILIGGVLCLLLGATGVVYVIGSNIGRRRKKAAAQSGTSSKSRYAAKNDASGDYGDGYSESKKRSRAARQDTDDIVLEDLTDKKSAKKNGKRYK